MRNHQFAGPAGSKIELDRLVHDCAHKHAAARGVLRGHAPPRKILKFDALRSLLRPFLDPASALPAALGRL